LGPWVECDDPAVLGEFVQLGCEDGGRHHPAGDENNRFVARPGFSIVQTDSVGCGEEAALRCGCVGCERKSRASKSETSEGLEAGASTERWEHGRDSGLRERGLRVEGARSIRFRVRA
jgi:hypothetical protein